MSIPKQKHCNQDWLGMTPTRNGRLCGECKKNIVDFSKKSWSEIEEIQSQNNNALCGMYSNKQIKYWGQQAPLFTPHKAVITTALLLGLSTANLAGQTTSANQGRKIILIGTVTGKNLKDKKDSSMTLPFTLVKLKNTDCVGKADINGNYQLDITNFIDSIEEPTLVFSTIGYDRLEYRLEEPVNKIDNYDVQLVREDRRVTTFRITRPSRWQRFKNRIKRIFN